MPARFPVKRFATTAGGREHIVALRRPSMPAAASHKTRSTWPATEAARCTSTRVPVSTAKTTCAAQHARARKWPLYDDELSIQSSFAWLVKFGASSGCAKSDLP